MKKASRYNVFFPYDNKVVGYNSISDKFIILEEMLYDLFIAAERENILLELNDVHEELYRILLNYGFVIDSDIDELEKVKEISYEHDFKDSIYHLIINPTMNCNFKCWYCYESHIKGSKMSNETLDNIVKYIDNIIYQKSDKLKAFYISWFGGEPMLYFSKVVLPLLENIYPKMVSNGIKFSSGFTTNGLLIKQEMLDECKKYGVTNFQITLDGDKKRHDEVRYVSKNKGSYDKIIKNIKLCLKNNFTVNVRINISEETVKGLSNIIRDFEEMNYQDRKNLRFSFQEIWQEEKDLTNDITEIVDEFRLNNFTCSYKGEHKATINKSCYADKYNQATINYDGKVFKCTARDFKNEASEGVLLSNGSIKWNDKFNTRMYEARFSNAPCLECSILPVCNGGCSQYRMENLGSEYCVYDFDEAAKIELIRQKFYSRIVLENPTDHLNENINSLLSIDFSEFLDKKEESVFQKTLDGFITKEVSKENVFNINEVNNLYSGSLLSLRKGLFDNYKEDLIKVNKIFFKMKLNEIEEKVASVLAIPVKAYYEYKLRNYDEAIILTNNSILNDDYFLDRYPFLYGHKIQQLHNVMRIFFKSNQVNEGLLLCSKILNHLLYGVDLNYNIGYWYSSYDIEQGVNMVPMVYQIFTETVRLINNLSDNEDDEYVCYDMAFNKLLKNDKEVIVELKPIIDFLNFKKKYYLIKKWDDRDLLYLKRELLNNEFSRLSYPLFKSLFSSLGINTYVENKKEFDRAYL